MKFLERRGSKAASANVGSQVGLMQTVISNTENRPAPAKSSIQATANKVKDVIQKTNEEDMAHIRDEIKCSLPWDKKLSMWKWMHGIRTQPTVV